MRMNHHLETPSAQASANLGDFVAQALEEAIRERGQMNIVIAGRTGVGKSTLINGIFQGRMAETGQGRPVTTTTKEITKEGIPVSIWDTRGLELAAYRDTFEELERVLTDRSADPDPQRHIHVAWLCIQEDGRRVEEAEIELHRMLARHVPVIVVITKARADEGFRAEVQRLLPEAANIVRVRAQPEIFDDGHTLPPAGLTELVEVTSEVIPEGHRRAFAAAQRASIKHKVRAARTLVRRAGAAAATAGASPIPWSDAFVLVPIQVGMLAGVTATFGLNLSAAFLSTLLASTIGGFGSTVLGRTIATNLLKLIPGAGTIAGAAISSMTAATLTVTLGEAYVATLEAIIEGGDDSPAPGRVAEELKRRMRQQGQPAGAKAAGS